MNILRHVSLGFLVILLAGSMLQADTRMRGYSRKAKVNSPNPRPAASKSPNTTPPKSPVAPAAAPAAPAVVTPAPLPIEDPAVSAAREKKNLPGIVAWQLENADKGLDSAQYAVGVRYLKGDGLEKDEVLGRQWLLKAAKQGNNDAYEMLRNTDFFAERTDAKGRIIQSTSARHDFMQKSGFPKGKLGSVCHHIVAVEQGGSDMAANLQWLSIAEAREKETWEGYLPIPVPAEKDK